MRKPAVVSIGCEANQVGVQPSPGAVFIKLRRKQGEQTTRSMFIELTIAEASRFLHDLEDCRQVAIDAM